MVKGGMAMKVVRTVWYVFIPNICNISLHVYHGSVTPWAKVTSASILNSTSRLTPESSSSLVTQCLPPGLHCLGLLRCHQSPGLLSFVGRVAKLVWEIRTQKLESERKRETE